MTLDEELQMWRNLAKRLSLYCDFGPHEKIKEILTLINSWDYAHRAGNGELSDDEQQECIDYQLVKISKYLDK